MSSAIFGVLSSDGDITSTAANYNTAANGNNLVTDNGGAGMRLGQRHRPSDNMYVLYELFIQFDTSSLPDDAIIDSVSLSMVVKGKAVDRGFTIHIREYDWGATLTNADWVPLSQLTNYTLVADFSSADLPAAGTRITFNSKPAFINAVNKTGYTRLMGSTGRMANLDPPPNGQAEWVDFYTWENSPPPEIRPLLGVTYHVNHEGESDLVGVAVFEGEAVRFAFGEANMIGVADLSSEGLRTALGESGLVGVGDMSAEGFLTLGGEANLTGVASLSADGSFVAQPGASLTGVGRLSAEATGVTDLDFTVYDAYIRDNLNIIRGVFFYDADKPSIVSRQVVPQRTDVGSNPNEIRPDWGFIFGQDDFSGGERQAYYHRETSLRTRYYTSEGYDISEQGRLRHLHGTQNVISSGSTGEIVEAGGYAFAADGITVKRSDNGTTWASEDPQAGETAQNVVSLASEGDRLFAALGSNGVHVRDPSGVWSHYKPDGTNNLNISPATVVRWVLDRLIVVGGTGSRNIYEVTTSSSPSAFDTLPAGWRFVDVFQAAGAIHAVAVSTSSSMSKIYHYKPNSSGVLARSGVTEFPQGDLVYCGIGYVGTAILGGGRRNDSGGYDPIVYQVLEFDNQTGAMEYAVIAFEEGSGTLDLSVRKVATYGHDVITGWTLGSGAVGGQRDGLGRYNLARGAFSRYLKTTGTPTGGRVNGILPYKGRVLFSVGSSGIWRELSTYVQSAYLITSIGDFSSSGMKSWDEVNLTFEPLPPNTSVTVEYFTGHPSRASELDWRDVFTKSGEAEVAGTGTIDISSPQLCLRISSSTSGETPVISAFFVRAVPIPLHKEWRITRTFRILDSDRKDPAGPVVKQDPDDLFNWFRSLLNTWINFYEANLTWRCFVEEVATIEPAEPLIYATGGQPRKDVYVVRLTMLAIE